MVLDTISVHLTHTSTGPHPAASSVFMVMCQGEAAPIITSNWFSLNKLSLQFDIFFKTHDVMGQFGEMKSK